MSARAWNLAGAAAFRLGSALTRLGLALCGLAGALDARADSAGYWDGRRLAEQQKGGRSTVAR